MAKKVEEEKDVLGEKIANVRKMRVRAALYFYPYFTRLYMAFDTKPRSVGFKYWSECLMLHYDTLAEITIRFSFNDFVERFTDNNNLENKYVARHYLCMPKCDFYTALPYIQERMPFLTGVILFDENYKLSYTEDYKYTGMRVKKDAEKLTPEMRVQFYRLCAKQYGRLLKPMLRLMEQDMTRLV